MEVPGTVFVTTEHYNYYETLVEMNTFKILITVIPRLSVFSAFNYLTNQETGSSFNKDYFLLTVLDFKNLFGRAVFVLFV